MRAFVLGTAGHVDHGKTTLVRALTGTDTDRWQEEKRRGLTIDIGFARLALTDDVEIGVVDVPGHEDFVKNMLAGATGIDLLLLVVAADEGPMPQTREHLAIARMLGIRRGVVALTKADRVDAEWLQLAGEAAAEEVRTVLDVDWPIIDVSSTTGHGLEQLKSVILGFARDMEVRRTADLLRLPVDRSFTIRGSGTVVTGTIWSGAVSVGDTVRVLPGTATARVRGAQVHGEDRTTVEAGRRCAISLVGRQPGEVERGAVVVGEAMWMPVRRFGARIRLLPFVRREIEHGQRVRAYLGTGEAMVRVRLATRDVLSPGEEAWAVIDSETPIVCRARDRFVLRFYSPVTTIGGGEVASLDPPRQWRLQSSEWKAVLDGDSIDAVGAVVRMGGAAGALHRRLPLETGLTPAEVQEALDRLGDEVLHLGERTFPRSTLESAMDQTLSALSRSHARRPRERGMSLESLRAFLSPTSAPELVEEAFGRLSAQAAIAVEGPLARLPGHKPTLTADETTGRERLLSELRNGGLETPPPDQLARDLGLERALLNDLVRLLVDGGVVVVVSPEMLVTRHVLDEAQRAVKAVLEAGSPASPGEFRQALGTSRRFLIPLLEYFDREGVTRRTPEGRVAGFRQST